MFTSIPAMRTEPDLGLFPFAGDDVSSQEGTYPTYGYRESMAWNEPTHGYSPFFGSPFSKNKVMDASGDRITPRANA